MLTPLRPPQHSYTHPWAAWMHNKLRKHQGSAAAACKHVNIQPTAKWLNMHTLAHSFSHPDCGEEVNCPIIWLWTPSSHCIWAAFLSGLMPASQKEKNVKKHFFKLDLGSAESKPQPWDPPQTDPWGLFETDPWGLYNIAACWKLNICLLIIFKAPTFCTKE